ncbi:MAG: hypothetical protein Kow00122_03690 [Thermoleophilia bacterium]
MGKGSGRPSAREPHNIACGCRMRVVKGLLLAAGIDVSVLEPGPAPKKKLGRGRIRLFRELHVRAAAV